MKSHRKIPGSIQKALHKPTALYFQVTVIYISHGTLLRTTVTFLENNEPYYEVLALWMELFAYLSQYTYSWYWSTMVSMRAKQLALSEKNTGKGSLHVPIMTDLLYTSANSHIRNGIQNSRTGAKWSYYGVSRILLKALWCLLDICRLNWYYACICRALKYSTYAQVEDWQAAKMCCKT